MADEAKMKFQINESAEAGFKRVTMDAGRFEIFATGTIDPEASDRLQFFVALHKIDRAIVYFDSPGGSLMGGTKLGRTIRSLGFETGVKSPEYEYGKGPIAMCASACAYAYAGGTARFYDSEIGLLGLHQFYGASDTAISSEDAQLTSGYLVDYLDEMGVRGKAFALASRSTKNEMTWVDNQQAEDIGLANNGVEPTVAEIKLSQGKPYLRLEQNFNNVTSRVLIFCDGQEAVVMGGIVTTPERTREQSGYFTVSYLEFGTEEYLKRSDPSGFEVSESTIWIERRIPKQKLTLLTRSDSMGMWLENGGVMRWGAFLNLQQVRPNIQTFLENCGI